MAGITRTRWQAASPLLDELLDAEPDTRSARLAQIRQDDAALASTLESLLAQQQAVETAEFLEGSALGSAGHQTLAGQVVGSYTVERALGAGGMGTVWLARRSDGRYEGQAAVKFLNLALLGRGGAERFRREGNALARLTHPNIAHLIDAGVAGGQPYLVLEYVQGEPIDGWCDAQSLDVVARIRLFLQVLAAVSHAHGKLILHRDLKPSNILVAPDGQVKLLDFGIAKLLETEERAAPATELTQLAGRAFTPEYAAPEQVEGDEATMATDVYALGVLLFALLAGTHPTAIAAHTPVERLRALVEVEPARLSDAVLRAETPVVQRRASTQQQLSRVLRGDLDNIVAKALKKSAAERYSTVDALASDLLRYLNHEPVGARPDSLGYRVGKFVRRHRLGVGAAAAVLIALVAGAAGTAWQAVEARRAQVRAEASAQEATRQRAAAEFETRVARANHEFLSQVFGDAMRGGENVRMRERLDRAREMLRRRYSDDLQIHAILLLQVAGRYAELQDAQREAAVMQEVEALAQRSSDSALKAAVECIRAYDLLAAGRVDDAAPYLARGLALFETADDGQSLAAFECLRADSMMAARRKDPARAQQRMNELLSRLERSGRGRTRAYLSALGSLAYVHELADEPVPALEVTRRKIALDEALGSGDTLNSTIDLNREAQLLLELGRVSEAALADAQMRRRFTAADETIPRSIRVSIAKRALLAGRTEAAVIELRDLVVHYEREGPEAFARGTMLDLADGYWLLERPADAESMLRRFEERLARAPASANESIEATRLRALLALDRRDRPAARAHVETLVRTLDASTAVRRSVALKGRLAAGWTFIQTGDVGSARRQAELVLTLAESKTLNGQASAWVGAAHLLRARIGQLAGELQVDDQSSRMALRHLGDTVDVTHPLRVAAERIAR